ncbi:hypothetical protein [Enterococcus faecium]|uniref:hypothetical protein n=1 Tax=Enterococcus faecium TaxID=1352 RepID=UPI003396899F
MFSSCTNLTKLVLDNFDTSNVISLNLSSFNTDKVTAMQQILSTFHLASATSINGMFKTNQPTLLLLKIMKN